MAQEPKPLKLETTLAFAAVAVVMISIISIFVTLILTATGATEIPVIFAQLPLIGLPAGFLMIMIVLVLSVLRRSKGNRN